MNVIQGKKHKLPADFSSETFLFYWKETQKLAIWSWFPAKFQHHQSACPSYSEDHIWSDITFLSAEVWIILSKI